MDGTERARRRVVDVCRQPHTPVTLLAGVAHALEPELPIDRWCGLTLDPSTVIPTGGVHDEGISLGRMPRLLELEFGDGDVNQLVHLARARQAVATIASATGGRNHVSSRYRDVLAPDGIEHEVRAVFRDASGPWAALVLMRGSDASDFTAAEVALVASVADDVTRAIRRVLLLAEIDERADTEAPALLVLDPLPAPSVRHASASAARWLAEIDDGTTDRLPYALYSLALRARSSGGHELARLRTRSGRWMTAHAEPMGDERGAVSMILEPSRPHEVAHVLAAAYGLTPREADVVRLVAAGCSNPEIARLLLVSPYTVQDHLKRLFEKVGVTSRSELVSKLYFDHYHPRTEAGAVVGGDGWFVRPKPPIGVPAQWSSRT